jgi:hypothetical protein
MPLHFRNASAASVGNELVNIFRNASIGTTVNLFQIHFQTIQMMKVIVVFLSLY